MSELSETAPPPAGYELRLGRTDFETGFPHQRSSLLLRGTTLSHLSRTVEVEIIPRLVMAHAYTVPEVKAPSVAAEVASFAGCVLGPESHRAMEVVQAYRDRGMPLETIYLELLAPTAQHLRHLWMEDEWDFAEVTLALWRLQQLLRDFSPAFCADAALKSVGLHALLTPGPGENHDIGHLMFGLVLAGEFFRRDGWKTWIESGLRKRRLP